MSSFGRDEPAGADPSDSTVYRAELTHPQLCGRITALMECSRILALQAGKDGKPVGPSARAIDEELLRLEDELRTRDLAHTADHGRMAAPAARGGRNRVAVDAEAHGRAACLSGALRADLLEVAAMAPAIYRELTAPVVNP